MHVAARSGYANEAGTYAWGRQDDPPALSDWLLADFGRAAGAQVADVLALKPVEAVRDRFAPHERLRVRGGTGERGQSVLRIPCQTRAFLAVRH